MSDWTGLDDERFTAVRAAFLKPLDTKCLQALLDTRLVYLQGAPGTGRLTTTWRLLQEVTRPYDLNVAHAAGLRRRADVVPIEEQHTKRAFVGPDRKAYELERRETALVHRYQQYLQRRGHDVARLRIFAPGESRPLHTDLWDITARELIEAKGSVSRDALRLAVGQLLDYSRFADAVSLAVLVPSRPRLDLVEYLHAQNISIVYPEGGDWQRLDVSGRDHRG